MNTFSKLFIGGVFVFVTIPVVLASEPSFTLKSCSPDVTVTDNVFTLKPGDGVTFKCTVSNTGSDTANIRVFGSETPESNTSDKAFSTSVLVASVPAGGSAEAVLSFVPVFEGGSYRYDISLMGVGSDGKLGETIGTPISFTGKVSDSVVKIMSASLDKASYKEGDTAVLSLGLTSTEKASKDLSTTIALKKSDGSICSYVSIGNPVGLEQYPFSFLSGGVPCDVEAVEVSLVNNKDGSMVDAITVQTGSVILKENTQSASVAVQTGIISNLSMREIAMIIIGVLAFFSVVAIIFSRRKRNTLLGMLLWLFLPAMLLFATPSVYAGASCTYAGDVAWGAPNTCTTYYTGTIVDGGGGTLYNTRAGYSGSAYASCSNGSWVIGATSCNFVGVDCIFNGYVGWGSCGTTFYGSVSSGSSKTLTNTNTGYSGSATFNCNNQAWSQGASSCVSVGKSCTYTGSVSWGSGCGMTGSVTVPNGTIGTVQNTNAGHTGSQTYLCTDGVFSDAGSSCDVAAVSCNFSSGVAWDSCYSTKSLTIDSGQSVKVINENSTYSGSATYSCNNGTWSPGVHDCNLIGGGGGGGGAKNGVCSGTHYNCSVGTVGTTADYSTQWQWQCVGSGGGSTASCFENKIIAPAPTLTFSANPASITTGGSSTLSWSTTNATSCWATGGWTGWKAVNGSSVVSPTVTTTYTLECWNSVGVSSGQRSATVTITANPAPTLDSFTGTYGAQVNQTTLNLPAGGGNVILNWATSNTTGGTCTGYGGIFAGGGKPINGSQTVNVPSTTTFVLECWNASWVSTGQRSVIVNVAVVLPAPTLTFVASPSTVSSGGGSTLNWSTTNAVSCIASGAWSGAKAVSGAETQSNITTDKTYTLECQNSVGTKVSKTVTIAVTLVCNPDCSEAKNHCSGTSYPAGCGVCLGTRLCDYNWKEVAP